MSLYPPGDAPLEGFRGNLSIALLIAFAVYSLYLYIDFYFGGKKRERKRREAMGQELNGFIGKHIDEVLAVMPPPTKSVKHRGSNYISYYWIKTRRAVQGDSVQIVKGVRLFSAGSASSRETITILVDPETSIVSSWQMGDD
ncbi:hypothetical protein AGMMS49579_24900 [Spirochaetia bacterium]|nr:hypothetical protein AGMMS49579_24900 [Spirochaetia bacterium]